MHGPEIFRGITPGQFALLSQKAHAAGIEMNGNSGSASKFGVEVAWNYDPAAQELKIECLKAPFFMKTSDVAEKIRGLVQQSLA